MLQTLTRMTTGILREAFAQNRHIDLYSADLSSPETLSCLRCHGIYEDRAELLEHFKALQRVLRITAGLGDETPWVLLEMKLTSAMEVAALGQAEFVEKLRHDGRILPPVAQEIHQRARARRAELLPSYMNILQNNEPHISQAAI